MRRHQNSAFSSSYNQGAPAHLTALTSRLAQMALVGYLCQTALFAPLRYVLVSVRLEILWYVPDILGLMCIVAAVAVDVSTRRFRSLLFLYVVVLYGFEGYFVSGSVASVASTVKALVPLFCGLLLDRDLLTRPYFRKVILAFWLVACGGVVFSMYGSAPWSNLHFDGIGVTQAYKATQWTAGGDVRVYGFSGDQHGAASSILTLAVMLSLGVRRHIFYLVAVVSLVTVFLTTSRTNLLSLVIYVSLYLVSDLRVRVAGQTILKWSLRASFFSILVPVIVIGISAWYTAADVPKQLLSLWIRGNETWLLPFSFIPDLAPFAVLSGFGLGGVGFGLLQSDLASYARTIDNFCLFNFLTFGMPFLLFYVYQCRRMLFEQDPHRVMVFLVTVASGIPQRGWSDYLFIILFGYATACVFRGVPKPNKQTARRGELPGSRAVGIRERSLPTST